MALSFKTITNWVAITGAPSSGKTSVLEVLAKKGYRICHEAARELIEEKMRAGKTLEEVRRDEAPLQREILETKLEWSRGFDPDELVFFDRGIPDSLSYYRAAGMNPAAIMPEALEFRYKYVFFFDPLRIVHDGVRTESAAKAQELERLLLEDYRRLGYDPIRVPVIPVNDRVDFILKRIGK